MGKGIRIHARGGSMAEAAVTIPVVLMVLMMTINTSLAGYCAVAAADAANYGARMGAVARHNPQAWALQGVETALRRSGAPGDFGYAIRMDAYPGGVAQVEVTWRYPTMLAGLCSLFGAECPEYFTGTATSIWKKEGW